MREAGIERVVVVGLVTDHCVKETVIDALRWALAVGAALLLMIALVYRWVAARERAGLTGPAAMPLDPRPLD